MKSHKAIIKSDKIIIKSNKIIIKSDKIIIKSNKTTIKSDKIIRIQILLSYNKLIHIQTTKLIIYLS